MMNETFESSVLWWERPGLLSERDGAAGVRLQKVWLNSVGIVALIEVRRLDEEAQQSLAALMRMVSDSARQVRRSGPLLGIVVPEDPALDLEDDILRLSRNQEWHRGDFVLRYESVEDNAKKFMRQVLGPFGGVSPIAVDQEEQVYFRGLKEHLEIKGIPEHAKGVFEAVAEHQSRERASEAINALRDVAISVIEQAAQVAMAQQPREVDEENSE